MIAGKTVLAIIPARGGSKGIPRKNLRILGGTPLIVWTILEAKKSRYIDRLVLSSEDEEIIRVAREWECEVPFVRPPELATDETPGIEPVLHAIAVLPKYDYVVLLQPTSPLRTTADIDLCIERCCESGAPACVTISEPEYNPGWMVRIGPNWTLQPLLGKAHFESRRQDLPEVYVLNGAVYVARTEWLLKMKGFIQEETIGSIMPWERSMDIDTESDLALCEWFLSTRFSKKKR